MNEQIAGLVLVVWLPLVVVWAVVLVDIVRRSDLSRPAKAVWAALCTVLWPTLIAYLLSRPTLGRLETAEERTDPHARLVAAALDHEAGRITDREMSDIVRELRRPG